MSSLVKRVGAGIKHRWEERQKDRKRRAAIDAEVKERRQEVFYETYKRERLAGAEKEARTSAKRSAQGRRMPSFNVDMGVLAKGGASATSGLNFLSQDIFEGTGKAPIFPTSKRKGARDLEGGSKTITVKAGGTRITVRSGSDEEKKPKPRSIVQNIEDLTSLSNGGVGGRRSRRSNVIDDVLNSDPLEGL